MPRRCDEMDAQPLEVVDGIVQGRDFHLTAVAGTGVYFADGERTAQRVMNRALYPRFERGPVKLDQLALGSVGVDLVLGGDRQLAPVSHGQFKFARHLNRAARVGFTALTAEDT